MINKFEEKDASSTTLLSADGQSNVAYVEGGEHFVLKWNSGVPNVKCKLTRATSDSVIVDYNNYHSKVIETSSSGSIDEYAEPGKVRRYNLRCLKDGSALILAEPSIIVFVD
jgi:hypothetical protein